MYEGDLRTIREASCGRKHLSPNLMYYIGTYHSQSPSRNWHLGSPEHEMVCYMLNHDVGQPLHTS